MNQSMDKKDANADANQKYYDIIVSELTAGTDKNTIIAKLTEKGMSSADADFTYNQVLSELKEIQKREELDSQSIVKGIVGGILAAAVGGIIWGAIATWTNYEIGYLAIGIGFLCGAGVVYISGGKKGRILQVIATLTSLLGILTGKYIIYFYALKKELIKQSGAQAADSISILSVKIVTIFIEVLPKMVTPYDALWVILAITTAWRFPQGSGIKLPGTQL